MPVANIVVNANGSPMGAQLKVLQNMINQARNQARQIKEQMDQMIDGATNNYTALETQYGLTAGNGQPVYNLTAGLTGPTGLLEAAGIVQYCGRLD